VAERDQLDAEHGTRAHAPDVHAHAEIHVDVAPHLRPILFAMHAQRFRRRGIELRHTARSRPRRERLAHHVGRRRAAQAHRDRERVPVLHRDAMTARRHGARRRFDLAVRQGAEQLAQLLLELVLLAADERNHVAQDVEARDARITGAGNRLHARHHHRLDAERRVQRRERDGEHRRRAIGIADDRALPVAQLSLSGEQVEMGRIDVRDEQRHVRLHAERARVREHLRARGGESGLDLARRSGVEGGEHDRCERRGGIARFQNALGLPGERLRGVGGRNAPRARLGVAFPHAALARAQMAQLETRMAGQARHEALPDDAGCAEDRDRETGSHGSWRPSVPNADAARAGA
jgi:hypothetical protein